MSFEIRPIRDDEWETFVDVDSMGFGYTPEATDVERAQKVLEQDRTLAVFDGEEMVSTTAIYSLEMGIPGGVAPVAGVTWVAVKPTHRRRGLLRMMMRRQLQDVIERGEALAALWASESLLYGRYGYGMASQFARQRIERVRATLAVDLPATGKVRVVDAKEALERWPACHDRWRVTRAGSISRSPAVWDSRHINGRPVTGRERRMLAQYEEDGVVRGFVRYQWADSSPEWLPKGTLHVNDLIAETPEAYSELWKLVFTSDLVETVEAQFRPIDEPLKYMLADPRRLQQSLIDALWVRLVNVPGALTARRYFAEGAFTMTVRDDFLEEVGGTFRLETSRDGAMCARTTAAADIELDIADLGAVFLGSTRLAALAQAGRVRGSEEAVLAADAVFSWPVPAWCPEVF